MKKIETEKGKRKKVMFTFKADQAEKVFLSGDFNQWNGNAYPMKKNSQGIWQKSLLLEPGTYEFKFNVDGQWQTDQMNPLICDNCYGTKNNFVLI